MKKKKISPNRGKFPQQISWNALFYRYKLKAKKRKYNFDLTQEEFTKICLNNCYYCGMPPSTFYNKYLSIDNKPTKTYSNRNIDPDYAQLTTIYYNGVDRYKNSVGYTIENSVSCCWPCNKMKSDLDGNEFENRIKIIHANLTKKE